MYWNAENITKNCIFGLTKMISLTNKISEL